MPHSFINTWGLLLMTIRNMLLAVGLLLPLICTATETRADQPLDLAQSFAEQARQIRQHLQSDTYAEISQEDRRNVQAALSRMEAATQGTADIAAMDGGEKTRLFNDQEIVNTILTKARADSRVVCKREKTVGSHRAVNQCLTVAERRRLRDEARELLGANQRDLSKPAID